MNLGLSWEDTKKRLPADLVAACHNSEDSVTISGPPKSVSEFVKTCKVEGIFAKEVNSSGFAFHSKYIADAEPMLRKRLEQVSSHKFYKLKINNILLIFSLKMSIFVFNLILCWKL